MIKKIKIIILTLILFFSIFSISNAVWHDLLEAGTGIKGLIALTQRWLVVLMTVSFFYIVFIFITDANSGKSDDKKNLSWGIIALTVFFTLWGILAFLQATTFGAKKGNIPAPDVTITPYVNE